MSRTLFLACLIVLAGAGAGPAVAQQGNNGDANVDRDSLVRATRLMRKIDKDGDGVLKKSEAPAAWRRYRTLDANRDESISIDELRKEQSRSLESGEQKLNVVYKTVGQRDLLLDLYYPEESNAKSPYPVVVYTHGGGWAAGSKQGIVNGSFKAVFEELLKKGFAVASVNYRLCGKGSGVTMRDCVVDSKDAVRYLAKNRESFGLDPDRFFVMGDSAGGHIAQMLLLTAPESFPGDRDLAEEAYTMVAGVSWYGPCDFEKMELFNHDDRADFNDRFANRILGSSPELDRKLELYREVSPVNYLRKDSPPLLMIQGNKDTTIPVKHAYFMKEKAEALEAPVEIMIIDNAGHNWRKVDDDIDPNRESIVDRTVQFYINHL